MGELAELVLLNHPTLTKMIDRMVSDSLVYRVQDADDRRKVLMFSSDRGEGADPAPELVGAQPGRPYRRELRQQGNRRAEAAAGKPDREGELGFPSQRFSRSEVGF
jgi:hypothetical protein